MEESFVDMPAVNRVTKTTRAITKNWWKRDQQPITDTRQKKKEEISLSKKQYASDLVTNIQETKNLKLLLIKFVLQWMQHFNVL